MKTSLKHFPIKLGLVLSLASAMPFALAQDFPNRPITWVVGFSPGGISDQGVACPNFEDPIRTLNYDGTTIDTGILSPLLRNQWQLILAVAVAVGLVLALLTGAVIVKQLFR